MTTSHHLLGWLAVGLAVALSVTGSWSVAAGVRSSGRKDHRFAVDRLVIAVLGALVLSLASGLILLATDHRPAEVLHFLYAALAAAIVPIGYLVGMRITRPGSPRLAHQRDMWAVVTGVLLLAIAVRLFGTG